MKSNHLATLIAAAALALAISPAATAQTSRPSAAANPVLSGFLAELAEMIKSGVPDSIIRAEIEKQEKLTVSARQLALLKTAGASDSLIQFVYKRSGTAGTQSQTQQPVSYERSLPSCRPTTPLKLRVGIEPFDYSTVANASQHIFGTALDIGHGIRSLLTKRITDEGTLIPIETARVAKVEEYQDRNQSNRVRPGSGGQKGRMNGADLMLTGDIVAFGADDSKQGFHIPDNPWFKPPRDLNIRKSRVKVTINYRLVNVETGDIVASGEATGESQRTSVGVDGLLPKGWSSADFTSSNFQQTIIGEAVVACVNDLNEHLKRESRSVRTNPHDIEARVASVDGGDVILNIGNFGGVRACDRLELGVIVEEVRDPVTKELLSLRTEKYGEMVITELTDKTARGPFSGRRLPAAGDQAVRRAAATVAVAQ